MEKYPISFVIIAKNEESRLPDCFKSIDWAQEIVIVNDESTDRTVEIAEEAGAKVFHRKMDNEGRHRNFAIESATQPWIMSLDADERISPELAKSIKEMLEREENEHNAYSVAVKTFIGKDFIRGAGHYPAYKARIFKKGKFKYKEEPVHPPATLDGTCGRLEGDVIHYSSRDFEHWISKFNRETTLEAHKWVSKNIKMTGLKAFRKSVSRFLKYYFQKGGISTGFQGYFMCVFHALYPLVSYIKFNELKQNQES